MANSILNPILEYLNEIKTEGKPLDCKDKAIIDCQHQLGYFFIEQ